MATAPSVSGQPVQVASGNQLAGITQLLETLLGSQQTQTTSPGNTQALQQLLGQLQGADYSQLLQSVFQQAGGQIPGLQAAYTNAVGARSGGNSAVQANLERLMQQTALAGQQQVVQQQQQNQQIQANAGASVANATRGTTQTAGTKGKAGEIAGLLALTQGALKLTGSKDLEELYRKISGPGTAGGGAGGLATTTAAAPVMQSAGAGVSGAVAPQMSMAPTMQPFQIDLSGQVQAPAQTFQPEDFGNPYSDIYFPEGGQSFAPDMLPFDPVPGPENFTPVQDGFFPQLDLTSYF